MVVGVLMVVVVGGGWHDDVSIVPILRMGVRHNANFCKLCILIQDVN